MIATRSQKLVRRFGRKQRGKGDGSIYPRVPGGVLYASYIDSRGRRRVFSTKTRDRASAEQVLAHFVQQEKLVQFGVISARDQQIRTQSRTSIQQHLDAYMRWCVGSGQCERGMLQKKRNLREWFQYSKIRCLEDCSAESLSDFLTQRQSSRSGRGIGARGTGARVWNQIRAQALAFINWCCKNGRCRDNEIRQVVTRNEQRDLRRKRRALTADEVSRLLKVARESGREAWYLAALRAGLRKSDLQRLDWRNVEFLADGSGEIRFPVQKANREDVIPIDCELAAVLKQRHASMGSPSVGRVFPSTVMDRTRDRDFARAGIQKRDARGHVVDLHAFRMTLGTAFVRAGVPLVVAQRMLRHSDLKTTMSYYIDIGKKESREGLDQALKLL